MRKIKVFLVEDEILALKKLEKMLENIKEIEIVGTAKNKKEAVIEIKRSQPSLVFLDINLPDGTAFDILEELKDEKFMTIFITAYDEYAVKAFEKEAVDYILKPFDFERLNKAVQKALKELELQEFEKLFSIEKFRELFKEKYKKIFTVKLDEEILIIHTSDIYYFKAENKKTFLCTKDKKFEIHETLKDIEKAVDPKEFVRIHKSYIISLKHLKKIRKYFINYYTVILDNDVELKVGKNFLQELKSKLQF